MDWALEKINHHGAHPNLLALVTKGLIPGFSETEPPRTYAQHIGSRYTVPEGRIVGIGGPCIARELGLKYPTHVSFAAANISAANALRDHLQTEYYRVSTHTNFTSLEACAALKNFLCIGVSAMFTAHSLDNSYAKNPLAALFNQAVHELASLSQWIVDAAHPVSNECHNVATSIHSHSAFGLAGMGDLHVTVGGGRNSLLGRYLGQGCQLSEVMGGDMQGVTVEGVDTGRYLMQ